jgi:hypothetical protein
MTNKLILYEKIYSQYPNAQNVQKEVIYKKKRNNYN